MMYHLLSGFGILRMREWRNGESYLEDAT